MTEYKSEKEVERDVTLEPDHNPSREVRAEKDDGDHSSTARESIADTPSSSIEGAAPGHQLDVELGRTHDPDELRRIETRHSVRSRISNALSRRKSTGERKRLNRDRIPTTNLEEGIIGWESQDDPDMPMNFPPWRKWLVVAMVSSVTVITPLASSILSPGIASLDKEFHNDNTIVSSMTVSIYLLGYVVGPLFLAPLAELYGRRVVLCAANVFFCVWQIGCALAPNIAALIVFRFLCGVGGSGSITLGAGTVGDLFAPDQRGFAMGVWVLGPLFGPTIGPLIGGFVAQSIGWRWDFWIVLIIGAVITVTIEFFTSETNPRVLVARKVKRLQKELGRSDLKSCYAHGNQASVTRTLLNALVRPIKMLFLSPMVFFLSLYVSFVYGTLYLLFTTIPSVFEETYGFSVGITGLVYISMGLGTFMGWAVITTLSDKRVIRRAKANNNTFVPEMRLPDAILFTLFPPVTFFWYGWSTYYRTHWIVPIISLAPFGFGTMGIFLPLTTYLVDAYPTYAASAVAANTVLRSLVGALLPLAGPTMYSSLGLGWGNSLLGFITVAMIPIPLVLYRYGARLRAAETFKL